MEHIYKLGHDISLIDLYDLGRWKQTGCYVLHEESMTIIETSASPSIPYLLDGLRKLEIKLEDIKYIIVTHIHLDHSGGAGLLLQSCPNAKVIVHPIGKRHLIDPTKLIASAKTVYQNDFENKFAPIIPIPEERIVTMNHGEKLVLSENRELTFYHTKGHANHHFSIWDNKSKGIFTGDSAGIYYGIKGERELVLPTTSPVQFDYNEAIKSIELMESLQPQQLFFAHFGTSLNPNYIFNEMKKWLRVYVENALIHYIEYSKNNELDLFNKIREEIAKEVVLDYEKDGILLEQNQVMNDIIVSTMGLIHFMNTKRGS